jgi:hypothetical protein
VIAFAQPGLLEVLGLAYLGAGAAVAWRLRDETSWAALCGAVVAWPVFLPMIGAPDPAGTGPYRTRIQTAFASLERTLADPAAGEVPWDADLTGLREALLRTDERLGLVDRLLAESGPARADALVGARARTGAEIEAVLDEVVQLRLQIGLAALAGDAASVRERLTELLARARALDEVATHG